MILTFADAVQQVFPGTPQQTIIRTLASNKLKMVKFRSRGSKDESIYGPSAKRKKEAQTKAKIQEQRSREQRAKDMEEPGTSKSGQHTTVFHWGPGKRLHQRTVHLWKKIVSNQNVKFSKAKLFFFKQC